MGPRSWGIGTLRAQLAPAIDREIEGFRPDVVHAHGLMPAGILAMGRHPLVVTGHGSETYALAFARKGLERLGRAIVRSADATAAVSRFTAERLERLGARDVEIIHNGADPTIFRPSDRLAARIALDLPRERPVVLFAGHLHRDKGVWELAAAAEMLRDRSPYFVLAGKGADESALAERFARLGVDVRFTGSLAHELLAQYCAAATVFTLPSYREGLPTVVCEAMNAGRAVVATDVGGVAEIVRDGVSGFVVPAHSADALASRLRSVIDDEDLRASFEREAYAFARESLTWERNAECYEALYHRVMTAPRALRERRG